MTQAQITIFVDPIFVEMGYFGSIVSSVSRIDIAQNK
jgi:hypothetical protein